MNLLDHYKFNKGKDVNQYIIKNLIVTENYKHSLNQYKNYITKEMSDERINELEKMRIKDRNGK